MTIPKRSRKGIQSIMTHADRSIRAIRPHRAFMRVSAIELEKARRHTERVSLLQRLREIDDRCRDLEMEKENLLRILGERKPDTGTPAPRSAMDAGRPRNTARSYPSMPKKGKAAAAESASRQSRSRSTRPGGSEISRMLKRRKPEPLRPLPERTGQGLRIKY